MAEFLKGIPKIEVTGGAPIAPPAGRFQMVAVDALVVDSRYQREVMGGGIAHVQRLAKAFDWRKFAPLIVAPVPGRHFAVIDGQHRAAAARARGIRLVPAFVHEADLEAQAEIFAALNGDVTPIKSFHVFKAALAAGQGWAREVAAVATAAAVTVLTYPKPRVSIAAGETMAVAALRDGVALLGRVRVVAALKAVTTGPHNRPGMLNVHMIKGLFEVVARLEGDEAAILARLKPADLTAIAADSVAGAAEAGVARKGWIAITIREAIGGAAP